MDLEKKKRLMKQKEMLKRQELDMRIDTDLRDRVNQQVLQFLLENTRYEQDPEILKLHSKLKAYARN
jgi:hypothetical protein